MKLIIEAGSSKTDYALVSDDGEYRIQQTDGMNPVTDPLFDLKLRMLLKDLKTSGSIDEIHYYGAGCVGGEVNLRVEEILKSSITSNPAVQVNDDLLAACRALCGQNPGIVGILGTGSNTCYYDGGSIKDRMRSCGYLLGDEGSGYQLGKEVYLRLCRGQLKKTSHNIIVKKRRLAKKDPVVMLYEHDNPRTFLASFAKCLSYIEPSEREEICDLVFEIYVEKILMPLFGKYGEKAFFCGSIAFHFKGIIEQKLEKNDIIAALFLKSPIEGLVKFHHDG